METTIYYVNDTPRHASRSKEEQQSKQSAIVVVVSVGI